MKRAEQRLSTLLESGDTEAYQKALRNYTLDNKRYKDMVDGTTLQLAHVNETALAFSKDQMPEMYAINYNQMAEVYEKVDTDLGGGMKMAGIRFDLVDENTVRRLIMDGDIQLPNQNKRLSIPKDQRWNTKQINSMVLQGIIQGESIKDISKRIFGEIDSKANKEGLSDKELGELLKRNKQAAIRNARTLVTGAENRGRLDSYKKAEKDGVVMKKVWMATPDGRTRDWHIDLDGQEIGVDEAFVDGKGNELMYPGDPGGAPETVYNCRCTMTSHVVGFTKADGTVYMFDNPDDEIGHDRAIEAEKERRGIGTKNEELKLSKGKMQISESDMNKYPNELETKGYVGLSKAESDEFIEKYHNKQIIGKKGMNTLDGATSRRINGDLRSGKMPTDEKDLKLVQRLDEAINKNQLPQDMTLFKGTSFAALGENNIFDGLEKPIVDMNNFKLPDGRIDFDAWDKVYTAKQTEYINEIAERSKELIGMKVTDDGFMQVSASSERNIFGFSDVDWQIHAKEGQKAYISDYKEESEMILPRETEVVILNAEVSEYVAENGNRQKVLQLICEII